MSILKDMLNGNPNYSTIHCLTVYAYLSDIDFYVRSNFKTLSKRYRMITHALWFSIRWNWNNPAYLALAAFFDMLYRGRSMGMSFKIC